ncbi:5985_t:CDS:2 [Funneliformis geosporum]|uniref:10158_t:CDS:1 n=1 Tax=Funneliformis geosporum TaxID=1117311 RepID=A0A9W4SY39_9GLOM|nr:5985_t:CDS:2 [Funneliformis geosporum]CAI2185128.1 10158_t:CDS:2 [Funneliformis geosporum]
MRQQSELDKIDLDDISPELCKKEILKNVHPDKLEFFRYNDRITPLLPVYPHHGIKKGFHTNSGLWYLIRYEAETKWETLSSGNSQYKKESEEEVIKNEFALNKIVAKIKPPEGSDEREISLSIQVKGEVLKKFLHKDGSSIGDVRKFKIASKLKPEINAYEFKLLIDELKKKKRTFKHVVRNESTCREFISAFMIQCVQSIEESLQLKAEEWLDGSCGFGPTDYAVYLESDDIVMLVSEVKKEDFEKGAAQNIVQLHSAVEHNIDEIDNIDDVPVLMYGIVTNALQWYFIRWAGSPADPIVEVSGPHQCEFDSKDMEQANQIAGYIASILQQVHGFKNDNTRPQINKRRRI